MMILVVMLNVIFILFSQCSRIVILFLFGLLIVLSCCYMVFSMRYMVVLICCVWCFPCVIRVIQFVICVLSVVYQDVYMFVCSCNFYMCYLLVVWCVQFVICVFLAFYIYSRLLFSKFSINPLTAKKEPWMKINLTFCDQITNIRRKPKY